MIRRISLSFLAILLGAACPVPAQVPSTIDGPVRFLRMMAENYPNEIAICVVGSDWYVPLTRFANPVANTVKNCAPHRLTAIGHTHPSQTLRMPWVKVWFYRLHGREIQSSRDFCYLSQKDVLKSRQNRAEYIIVAVDRDTWCWWTDEQVRSISPVEDFNWPPRGQLVSEP